MKSRILPVGRRARLKDLAANPNWFRVWNLGFGSGKILPPTPNPDSSVSRKSNPKIPNLRRVQRLNSKRHPKP